MVAISLVFSLANATADYKHHYFTGLYSLERNKQYDGSVDSWRPSAQETFNNYISS